MALPKELVAASATPIVLSILAQGESYGYAIIQKVGELSGGHVAWTDGMLYPVLHRLERSGLIESSWKTSEIGRKRKYYRLRQEGARLLSQERRNWELVAGMLSRLWEEPSCLISMKLCAGGATV